MGAGRGLGEGRAAGFFFGATGRGGACFFGAARCAVGFFFATAFVLTGGVFFCRAGFLAGVFFGLTLVFAFAFFFAAMASSVRYEIRTNDKRQPMLVAPGKYFNRHADRVWSGEFGSAPR